MFKKISSFLIVSVLLIMPIMTLAAVDFGTPPNIQTDADPNAAGFILNLVGSILDVLWIVFIAVAIIMFIVAGFQFLSAQGDSTKVSEARKSLIWGAVGVAAGIAAFSLPFIIRSYVGL